MSNNLTQPAMVMEDDDEDEQKEDRNMEAGDGDGAGGTDGDLGKDEVEEIDDPVQRAALRLSQDVRALSLGARIERVHGPLPPLQFLREFVMPGRPCIISNAIHHWPALRLWTNQYLCSVLHEQLVSVHFTPNGYADALVDLRQMASLYGCRVARPSSGSGSHSSPSDSHDFARGLENLALSNGRSSVCSKENRRLSTEDPEICFVTAHVEQLLFPTALEFICGSRSRDWGVAYAQQQNGCLLSEYNKLAADAEVHIPWATEALGCMPEAVNLWIGNERAITSFHKDHYENLYAVITGEKHFTLLPPTDVHRLYLRNYPSARYTRYNQKFTIELDGPQRTVPWVSVDPFPLPSKMAHARAQFPRYFEGPEPFQCTLQAGDMLYLPSMWFHHVRQTPDRQGRAIALNFWYDMQFDVKYAYYNFLQTLV